MINTQYNKSNNKLYYKGGKLFSSNGAFGCIFKPNIFCNGDVKEESKIKSQQKYLSKVQLADEMSVNEIEIGRVIREKIPIHQQLYATVEQYCDVQLSNIKDDQKYKCNVINNNKQAKFINMKIPYINGKIIIDYIVDEKETNLFNLFFNNFKYLLESIHLLSENGIVHMDLKSNNMIVDNIKEIPILIDFGLSMNVEKMIQNGKINETYLREIFYVYGPDYYIWCPEIHFINFLLYHNQSPSLTEIESFCDKIIKINKKEFKTFFNENEIGIYKKELYAYYKKFYKKQKTEVILELLQYYKTWDLYSISIMFIEMINYMTAYQNGNSLFNKTFHNTFYMNLYTNPKKRYTIQKNKDIIEEYTYLKSNKDVEFLEQVKSVYSSNKGFSKTMILKTKKLDKISKKLEIN